MRSPLSYDIVPQSAVYPFLSLDMDKSAFFGSSGRLVKCENLSPKSVQSHKNRCFFLFIPPNIRVFWCTNIRIICTVTVPDTYLYPLYKPTEKICNFKFHSVQSINELRCPSYIFIYMASPCAILLLKLCFFAFAVPSATPRSLRILGHSKSFA